MGRLLKKKIGVKKNKKANIINNGVNSVLENSDNKNNAIQKVSTQSIQNESDKSEKKIDSYHQGQISSIFSKIKYLDKSLTFLKQVQAELKKVTWPSKKQTAGSTIVVIILVLIMSLFFGLVDIGLSSLVSIIIQ